MEISSSSKKRCTRTTSSIKDDRSLAETGTKDVVEEQVTKGCSKTGISQLSSMRLFKGFEESFIGQQLTESLRLSDLNQNQRNSEKNENSVSKVAAFRKSAMFPSQISFLEKKREEPFEMVLFKNERRVTDKEILEIQRKVTAAFLSFSLEEKEKLLNEALLMTALNYYEGMEKFKKINSLRRTILKELIKIIQNSEKK